MNYIVEFFKQARRQSLFQYLLVFCAFETLVVTIAIIVSFWFLILGVIPFILTFILAWLMQNTYNAVKEYNEQVETFAKEHEYETKKVTFKDMRSAAKNGYMIVDGKPIFKEDIHTIGDNNG